MRGRNIKIAARVKLAEQKKRARARSVAKQRQREVRVATKERRFASNYRRLLRMAKKLAESFTGADELESVFVLRKAV